MRTTLSVFLRALRAPFATRLLRASAAIAVTLAVATCHSDTGGPCVGTLVFTAQPTSLTAGVQFSVTVQAQNTSGVLQSCFTDNVSLSVGSGPAGGTILGTTTVAAVGGVANFIGLTITKSGGYTLSASGGGFTAGTSAGFNTVAATATALSITTQPTTTTAGANIAPAVAVTVLDQFSNTAGIAGNVAIAITAGTGTAGATLSGNTPVSGASGIATFSSLSINRVGTGYTLTATATGLVPSASNSFNINPGATTKLVFTIQPSNASAGSAISPAITVTAQDAQSNPTPSFIGSVTVAIGNNAGPGGVLSGTLTATVGNGRVVNGVATFNDLTIDKPGLGYTLTANSGVLTGATSNAFNVAIGPLAQLVFTQQPTNATAGAAIAPAIVVTGQDAAGNTVTGFTGNVDMSIGTNPVGGTLSGDLTVAANAGVATFSNLRINKSGTGYTLTATAGSVNRESGTFNIIAGAATQLVFTVQPVNTAAGASVTPAVVVTAQDANNNTATSFGSAVTVAITGGTGKAGAALSGTLTKPAVSGVVSFTDLSIDSVGTGYTLSATAAGLVGAFASASFNITPNVATHLVFTTQPTNRTAGLAIAPAVVVTARDFKGNTATGFISAVTVAIGNNAGPGGVLSGNAPVNAIAGVATFANLSINKSGIGYTLAASSTGLTGATSSAFNIIAGAATKLAFTVQPVNTAAAPAAITPAVQVSAQDALNNTDLTFTANVTVAIGNNAGPGGILSGTLTATVGNLRLVNGVATFNDLSIDKVGTGYTLTANATGLSGATSAGFNIIANTATHLVFFVQPTNEVAGVAIAPAVVVHALDASNNVAGFTGGITVAITNLTGDPAATLSGNKTVIASAGVAVFSDLSINKTADNYTLDATAGGLTGATSATFDITPAAATHLVFSGQPSDEIAGAAIAPTLTVSALDAFDNVDTAYTTNIAVAIGTNPPPGTGILSGTTSAAAVNGVATFSDLSINRSGVGYTLLATSGLLTAANSAAFTITHAALNQLVFTVQPVNTGAGQTIAPDVTVAGQDQFGNTVTSFIGDVDIAIGNNAGPGGILSGTTTRTASTGTAAFNDLSIDKAGSGYTLSASTAGLGGTFASASFDITPGAANQLAFTVQPQNSTAGNDIAPPIVVTVQDAQGNTVNSTDDVTIAITGGTGTVGANLMPGSTLTVPASAGLATFSNLKIDSAGTNYTLSATAATLVGSFASGTFDITAGAATKLVFTVQPVTATAGPPATIPTVEVRAQDALGNTDPNFASDVTVAIGTNGGTPTPGSLSGTTTVANATAGVAIFSNLSIDKKGPGYTLAASTTAGGVTGATSTTFDINAGAATTLVLTQQPSNAVAGASIVPAVTVEARDNQGNVDPNFIGTVLLAFVNDASGGTATLANASLAALTGVATFPNLNVNKVGTGYTIRATSGGLTASATSSAFNITPGLANNLAFTVQPTQTTVGANISPAVRVTVRDINGNTVTSFSGNVVVAITLPNGPGGTLGGTLTKAAVAGVATFSALDIDVAGSYQLTATSTGLTPATSVAFNIIPSVATQLVFTVHPKTTTAGAAITGTLADVEVTARDASGQTATGFTGDITLSITPGTGTPGAVLGGTTTETAGGGIATFPNLLITTSGSSYKLTASAVGGAPPTEATSGFFSITHDAADHLEFKVQPSNATINAAIAPPVEVKAVDQFGNTATGFTADVLVTITPNPSGGVLSGTLTKAAVQGVATFTNLSIDQPSFLGIVFYELNATTPAVGVGGATSTLFDITSGASNRLVVHIQPPNPTTAGSGFSVRVIAEDAVGDTLVGFSNPVTLSITAGTGTNGATLSGLATVTPVNGIANFSGLSIDKSGFGYRLSATATNIAGATTALFTINAGAASQVDFIVHPTTTGAGLAIQPAVQVEVADALGNRVTNFVGNVTVAIFTNPSGGTLSGTATAPVSTGVASFNNLSIDAAGTGYRLQASSGALGTDISSAFSITAGTATQLIFTVAPSNQTAGLSIAPAVRVTALDALGNVAPTFGGDVTVAITSGTGALGATLTGVLTQTAITGVATFPGLSIDKAAVDYTLSATTTTPAVTGTTSATFTITHAAATHLVFTVQPTNTAANAFIPAVQVTARDQFENLVTAFVGNVTVAMGTNAGGPGSILSGTLIRPVTTGVATFDNLSINNVGVGYTLTAQTGAFPLAGSAAFNIF